MKKVSPFEVILLVLLLGVSLISFLGDISKIKTTKKVINTNGNYSVMRLIDGDTVEIAVPNLPDPLEKKLHLRILGVDTPEKGRLAKCELEKRKAGSAKAFTEDAIKSAQDVKIQLVKWDKYGGRVLGYIYLDNRNLSEILIERGYAVAYDGQGEKNDWCKK